MGTQFGILIVFRFYLFQIDRRCISSVLLQLSILNVFGHPNFHGIVVDFPDDLGIDNHVASCIAFVMLASFILMYATICQL